MRIEGAGAAVRACCLTGAAVFGAATAIFRPLSVRPCVVFVTDRGVLNHCVPIRPSFVLQEYDEDGRRRPGNHRAGGNTLSHLLPSDLPKDESPWRPAYRSRP